MALFKIAEANFTWLENSTVERLTTDASAFLTKDCASLSTNVGIDLIAIAIVAKLECKVTNYSSINEIFFVKNLIPDNPDGLPRGFIVKNVLY